MTDDNLGDAINSSFHEHKREIIIENLAERLHLTLDQVTKLTSHPDHGPVVSLITLREIFDEVSNKQTRSQEKSSKKDTAAKVSSKKGSKKPKGSKSTPKKKDAKKKVAKKKDGSKADKGKPKPRLDYETGMREVLSALQSDGEPAGRQVLEDVTGYTGVQVRAFCKRLVADGKVRILGEGGRSTKYQAV
jgi:hypothetical protein